MAHATNHILAIATHVPPVRMAYLEKSLCAPQYHSDSSLLSSPRRCGRDLSVEESAEAGVAGAADGELGAVGEDGDVSVLCVGLDFDDALQVDDVGAMDA